MPRRFEVAPLPRNARVVGGLAVALGVAAVLALVLDLAAGRSPLVASGFLTTVSLSLGWVWVDKPTHLELSGKNLVIVTGGRRRRLTVRAARLASPDWHGGWFGPKFAINGGFGWYGWFWHGGWQRAFVTDPARAVRLESATGPVLVSPADPGALLDALRGD